jgi:hypothetical protein
VAAVFAFALFAFIEFNHLMMVDDGTGGGECVTMLSCFG